MHALSIVYLNKVGWFCDLCRDELLKEGLVTINSNNIDPDLVSQIDGRQPLGDKTEVWVKLTNYKPSRFKSLEESNKQNNSTYSSRPINEENPENNANTNLPCRDPESTVTCPICLEDEGIVTKKFESWELFEHLESNKHTKSNLASFFAYEAVSKQFWEDE